MKRYSILLAFCAASVLAVGCDDPNANNAVNAESHADHDHGDHDHDSQDHLAPHGGHLIELGRKHEYHAELVDDHDTESIVIYLMDSQMKSMDVDHPSLTLVLTVGDETETFELWRDQKSASSRFSSNDKELMSLIDKGEFKGKLRVTIKGTPFSGAFEHFAHGHEDGHSHSGQDH